jgi:DNA-binding NarL/FixJ family response regulator
MLKRPALFLADAESLLCELVSQSLADSFDIIGSAYDGPTTVSEVERLRPDVVILNVVLPLLSGIDAATRIRKLLPSARIIFLAAHYQAGVARRALEIGALGFLLKTSSASELRDAIWTVLRGKRHVTPSIAEQIDEDVYEGEESSHITAREREVVKLLAEGRAMKQAAKVLQVAPRTIAFHKYNVMRKFDLHSSADLVRLAVSQGLVTAMPGRIGELVAVGAENWQK